MKLFVWEGYFCDYTDGLAVVIAPDLEEARRLLRERVGFDHPDIDEVPKEFLLSEAGPMAFYVHGAG